MAKKITGLGRGLGALIPQKKNTEESKKISSQGMSVQSATGALAGNPVPTHKSTLVSEPQGAAFEVELGDIVVNPEQPRMTFRHRELEDLMNSIREHGIIQPLTVTKKKDGGYELIAGERRFRAANMLGLKKVPVTVRVADTKEKLIIALIENIQREDLNPVEEARGFERLMEEFNFTQEEVSKKVGKARSTVANTLRLLDLPDEIQAALADGVISAGSARAILSLKDRASQLRFFKKLVSKHLSTRDVEEGVRKSKGEKVRKDPAVAAIEEQIRESLGAKVEIKKRGEKGTVVISFFTEEEYKDIVNSLVV